MHECIRHHLCFIFFIINIVLRLFTLILTYSNALRFNVDTKIRALWKYFLFILKTNINNRSLAIRSQIYNTECNKHCKSHWSVCILKIYVSIIRASSKTNDHTFHYKSNKVCWHKNSLIFYQWKSIKLIIIFDWKGN